MTAAARIAQPRGARERRERIREQVVDRGFVRIEELAAELRVSGMTIHRDLDHLERQGWLRKVRGGATAQPSAQFHGDIRYRLQTMTDEKADLARSAMRLVEPGQALMLDESTTALQLVHHLPERAPLTVITHFLAAINALARQPGIELIALGGAYYSAYDAFFGLRTVESIRSLRADVLFMSTTAISGGACFHQSIDTVQVNRAQMEASAQRVLLIDHTKLHKQALHELAPLSAFDLVLVDRGIDAADLARLREHNARVEIAEPDAQLEQAAS